MDVSSLALPSPKWGFAMKSSSIQNWGRQPLNALGFALSFLLLHMPQQAQAASFSDQAQAMMNTAYAIEANRRAYEEESKLVAYNADRAWRDRQNSAADASHRMSEACKRLNDPFGKQHEPSRDAFFNSIGAQPTFPQTQSDSSLTRVSRPGDPSIEPSPLVSSPDLLFESSHEWEITTPTRRRHRFSNAVLYGGVTSGQNGQNGQNELRTPRVSVVQLIHKQETELIQLHAEGRLGSFDVDNLSARLLAIKKNYAVMISNRGSLSPSQESTLRGDLSNLDRDITVRGH